MFKNTTNNNAAAATLRSLESLVYELISFALPLLLWYMTSNPKWVGLVVAIRPLLAYAKQMGWLPTSVTVQ